MTLSNKRFLIFGVNGQLGQEFHSYFIKKNISAKAVGRLEADITDFVKVEEIIQEYKPDIIINCTAYNAVDDAEDNKDLAYLINSQAVKNLANICKKQNIFLVHYSSDYVFDGKKGDVYTEADEPNPVSIYGKSKLKGEQEALDILSNVLVFRLSWVIGKGKQNFLYKLTQWAKNNSVLKISSNEISVPTFTNTIVKITLLSLEKELTGLYHLTNSGCASRYELAEKYIQKMGLKNILEPVLMETFSTKAKRPGCSAMSNQKISEALNISIPKWDEEIMKYNIR